ncbi:MAG: DUF1501 domain-containing protein [Planctomycetota bacterium]
MTNYAHEGGDWLLADMTRRDVLMRAVAVLGVCALPTSLFAAHSDPDPVVPVQPGFGAAKSLILLYMAGGMSHLDTLDPKPGQAVQGPIAAIPSVVDGVQLGEHMVKLAQRMDRCALIRSLTSTQGAHEQGDYYLHTSYTARGTTKHPTLGAWAAQSLPRLNPTLPPYVTISGGSRQSGAGFLDAAYGPLPIGDPSRGLANISAPSGINVAREQHRRELLQALDGFGRAPADAGAVKAYHQLYSEAEKLMASRDLAAFDIAAEPEAIRAMYGNDAFANGCLMARRLVEHGVRTVEVTLGGWDTHDDNETRVKERCSVLDRTLSALLDDLQAQGLLATTVVALVSEFGRSPVINQHDGRDHHPKCFSALLAGGGVRGGRIHGASDERGDSPAKDPVGIPDLNATLAHALGCDLAKVTTSPDGRPFTVADKGKPIAGIFT